MISDWHVGSARGEAVSGIVKTQLDRNEPFSIQAFLFKQRLPMSFNPENENKGDFLVS